MSIKLEPIQDGWRVSDGFTFLLLTDDELRELVTLAVAGDLRILPE